MTRELTHLDLLAGPGGWVQASWRRADDSEGRVYARFKRTRGKTGWWRLTDLYVPAVSAALVRDVPLRKVEVAVNASPPVLETLADWLADDPPADLSKAFKGRYHRSPRHSRLKKPTTRRLDDDFYRDVAWAYREAAARGENPGKTLARDSETPQGTVNRWIAKARELNYLPPGEPGRVTA
jgi:hypothetical protein